MKNKRLDTILDITVKLSQIKRNVRYSQIYFENDAEHCYQLALAAWSVNHEYNLDLHDEKLLKLALVHDIIEIFTGDYDGHRSEELQKLKLERDKAALKEFKREYKQLSVLIKEIEEYEKKESSESKLINILDKAIPIRHVHKINDTYYKKRKITLEKYVSWFYSKVAYEHLPTKLKNVADDLIDEVIKIYTSLFYT